MWPWRVKMPTKNLLRLLLLLMLVLATVCRRFGSWGLLTKLNFCSDFEQFGQDFEVEVQARFCDRRNSSPGIIYSRHFFQLHPSSWSEIFHKLQKVCSVENLSRALHFVNFLRFVLTSCSLHVGRKTDPVSDRLYSDDLTDIRLTRPFYFGPNVQFYQILIWCAFCNQQQRSLIPPHDIWTLKSCRMPAYQSLTDELCNTYIVPTMTSFLDLAFSSFLAGRVGIVSSQINSLIINIKTAFYF